MTKDLTCKLKRENTVAQAEYSTLGIEQKFKREYNGGSSEFEYFWIKKPAYTRKQRKSWFNKITDGAKVMALVGTVGAFTLFASGCPSPYEPEPPKPTQTEQTAEPSPTTTATPIVTEEPTPVPTTAPTPDEDYVDISGNVKKINKNGTYEGDQAIIRIFDNENNGFLGEFPTESNGSFSVSLDKLIDELPEGVRLEAKLTDSNGNATSYNRKTTLPQGDHSNVEIYPVPYPEFCTPEEFRQHIEDTNSTFSKWDLENFEKIKIFKYNEGEEFNDDQIAHCVSRITDSNDIEKFVKGKELDDCVEIIDGSPSQYWESNCIYVVPDNTPGGNGSNSGYTYTQRTIDRVIYKARIELNPSCVNEENKAASHELGHAFVAPDGEATHLSPDCTVMQSTGAILTKAGIGDEKSAQIVYGDYSAGEDLNDFLEP